MWGDEQEVPADELPDEAREYAQAILAFQDHPAVKQYFHQITLCQLPLPDGGTLSFFVLEFRDGLDAVLVWSDGQGNWAAGDWQRLPSPDGAVRADVSYFQGRPAARSFAGALQQLLASRPGGGG
jgi:hypothetical protein